MAPFNAIITINIRLSFNFLADDPSVKANLNIDINKFRKKISTNIKINQLKNILK